MPLLSRQPREGGAWDLKSVWLIADGLWFRTKRRRADRPSPSTGRQISAETGCLTHFLSAIPYLDLAFPKAR